MLTGTQKIASALACLLLCWVLVPGGAAQAASPVQIHLTVEKKTYLPGEPIKMQIRVYNNTLQDVILRKGLLSQDLHKMIDFTAPDKTLIRSSDQDGGSVPGPPEKFQGRDAVLVEVMPPFQNGEKIWVIDDVLSIYNLTQYGAYTAQLSLPIEIFSQYDVDSGSGNLFAYYDDPGRQSFDPLESNKVDFRITAPEPVAVSAIRVEVNKLIIGGGSGPSVKKTPLEDVPVRLIQRSSIPEDYAPVNWKIYPLLWDNVDSLRTSLTDSAGIAMFEGVPQDDYVIIALYNESQDFRHMGSPVDGADTDWGSEIRKHLMVMEKMNGRKVPAKTTRLKGSELLITEPEYVIWDSTEELYPFVFETVGDWEVETSISPPEGFVSDHELLSADVNNELEAVQFTITDVGSRWEETEILHKIKHKGKSHTVKTKVGVKLSEKLAKKKGLGVYGHTKSPGSFKGGRKVESRKAKVKH